MKNLSYKNDKFDRTNPLSIFNYSQHLIGNSLRSLLGNKAIQQKRKGKGSLGQMVEALFFNYDINSNREADFSEAHVELKCTPLLKTKDESYRIKERLVCTMIDFFEIVETSFENSHLISKCQLMLILFYLHVHGEAIYDYEFLYRVLWHLPEKDLQLIKQDYQIIADKVRKGEAHLLSEGDTLYLGACRKGKKGDKPQPQPNSNIKAPKRAFSLKPAYMRFILNHVLENGKDYYTNYREKDSPTFELVSNQELKHNSFENIILNRFHPFLGLDYIQICNKLGIKPYQSKSKYADIGSLIASNLENKRLNSSEEFIKSGIIMKTVRLKDNGMPVESMSFKNIDYMDVYENDDWFESEVYELFTNKFMFVVFKPVKGKEIRIYNNKTKEWATEPAYVLDKVFFWTMPSKDLDKAYEYWKHIRKAVIENKIEASSFWSVGDHKKFHVRPKAKVKSDKTHNPHGGLCDKFCYWFNADYVKEIIDSKNDE